MEIGLLERWPVPAPGPEREEAYWTGLLRGSIRSCLACWLLAKGRSSWRELTWQAEPAFCFLEASRPHPGPGECACLGAPSGISQDLWGGLSTFLPPPPPEPAPSSRPIRRRFPESRSTRTLLCLRISGCRVPARFSGGELRLGLAYVSHGSPIEFLLKKALPSSPQLSPAL